MLQHVMRGVSVCVACAGVALLSTPASADSPADSEAEEAASERWAIGAGPQFLLGLTDVQLRDSDVLEITQPVFWALEVAPRYALGRQWTTGVRGVWGSDADATRSVDGQSRSRTLWSVALELRFLPFGASGPWLGGEAGAAAIHDGVTLQTSAGLRDGSRTQWAPGVALALGYQFLLASEWSLDLVARSQHLFFESADGLPGDGQNVYGTTQLIGVGTALAYRF